MPSATHLWAWVAHGCLTGPRGTLTSLAALGAKVLPLERGKERPVQLLEAKEGPYLAGED